MCGEFGPQWESCSNDGSHDGVGWSVIACGTRLAGKVRWVVKIKLLMSSLWSIIDSL
jgi:hypothetical protein